MFDEQAAAQMAAYLLMRQGGEMSGAKLNALMYLAEREHLRLYGHVLSGDALVAMPHGPALAAVHALSNGMQPSAPRKWAHWLYSSGNQLVLLRQCRLKDLGWLSRANRDALRRAWKKFGHLDEAALGDCLRQQCPEWRPQESSVPIPLKTVFRVLGFTPTETAAMLRRIAEQEGIQEAFARLESA